MANIIKVSPDSTDIIRDIAHIADAVALPKNFKSLNHAEQQKWQKKGFLVSGYGAEKYKKLAGEGRLFATMENDRPVAFLLIYFGNTPVDEGDLGSTSTRQLADEKAFIVKQIGVRTGYAGKGHGKALYHYFENEIAKGKNIYLAVVSGPINWASEVFHTKAGFEPLYVYDHPDRKPRTIWVKPADSTARLRLATRFRDVSASVLCPYQNNPGIRQLMRKLPTKPGLKRVVQRARIMPFIR